MIRRMFEQSKTAQKHCAAKESSSTIGALIIRIGFGGFDSTIPIVRNPQNVILMVKAPTLYRYNGSNYGPVQIQAPCRSHFGLGFRV